MQTRWITAGWMGIAAGVFVFLTGCTTATVDRGDAQAQTGAPEAADVPIVSIPADPAFPTYIVAVEPFEYAASGTVSGRHPAEGVFSHFNEGQIGPGISAQFVTALTRGGNIQVVEFDALKKSADNTYSISLEAGEVGPFIIKGAVTEFNETADLSGQKKGGSFGIAGAILGIAGAVTGKDALTYTGAGITAANPSYTNEKMKRKGMVAMDVRIVNGANNRIMGGFSSSGTFATVTASSGFSLFGFGKGNEEFAASALGQATRAAMNDALQQTSALLKTKVKP
jgi:curli biogenesis system outer membrane secretion channel CsgG